MKKTILTLIVIVSSYTAQSQKLLWASQTGGTNNNGAIIEYDLSNSQVSTLGSLGGNFMKGYNLFLDLDSNHDTWNTSGMIMGADGNLYGVNNTITSDPVLSNVGGIYQINTATNTLKLLHTFSRYDLHKPALGLIEASPGVFYGVTIAGGEHGYGGIWKFDANGGGYSEIASFDALATNGIGRYPISPLIIGPNGDLFGIVRNYGSFGSGNDQGHLYKIEVANDNVSIVSPLGAAGWAITGPIDQIAYNASLNKIFGTKEEFGGLNTGGGVYSYNFNTQTVTNETLIDNTQTAILGEYGHGMSPQANDGFHYFLCRGGGAYGKGTLVKYSPGYNTMVKIHDFTNVPNGTGITISGTKVMGTYSSTSPSEYLVWSYDVSTLTFTDLIFGTDDDTLGYFMSPSFAVNNNELFGITRLGGSSAAGSIFKYNLVSGAKTIIQNNQSTDGRGLVGEMAIVNNSIAYAHVSSGGKEVGANEYSEQGGLAKINLQTGNVVLDENLSSYVNNYAGSHTYKYSKPLISQSGNLYTSNQVVSSIINQVNYSEIDVNSGSNNLLFTESIQSFQFSGIEHTPGIIIFALGDSYHKYNATSQSTTSLFSNTNSLNEGYFVNNLTLASDGRIYGTTISTDDTDPLKKCIIYSVDNNFGNHTVEKTFDAPITELNNGLTEVNGKLYGSTIAGGTNNDGYLFSLEIATGTFTIEHNFNATTDGKAFLGEWTEYNGKLYAVSYSGGQNGYGTLVEFELGTGSFNVIENFTIDNGRAYRATPVFWDNTALSITDNINQLTMKIFPNPAETVLNVDFDNVTNFEIYSTTGQLIKKELNTNKINIKDLTPGIYIVKVYSEQGSYSSKFIKE